MKKKKGSFEKKLKAYSAVAAGTLLLAPSANAAVQYSGLQNIGVGPGSPLSIDLNNDGNDDFNISYYTYGGFVYYMGLFTATSGSSHIAEIVHYDAARLPSNYSIRAALPGPVNYWENFIGTYGQTLNGSLTEVGTSTMGNFNNATGYIGVSFNAACGTAYGWIQYAGLTGQGISGTVIDWAYEDTCTPILAGDTVGAPAIGVPTLNQWGLFALIALLAGAGVTVLRKQEQA